MARAGYALVLAGLGTLGGLLYYYYLRPPPGPDEFPEIKLTRAALVSYWPPRYHEKMRVALLRPDPPRPGKWIPAIYEVPTGDFASFPRSYRESKDAYYYDKKPWEWYEDISWHLLLESKHEYVIVDIWPKNRGWVLVLDAMWWEQHWFPTPHWDLYAVSGDGIIE